MKISVFTVLIFSIYCFSQTSLKINDSDYFEKSGLNVMVFHDYYPDGHQTGVTIIQHGERVAANGDLRLEPSPGQWSPMPKFAYRKVDKDSNQITATLWYPDSSKDRKGFNPIIYPDLQLKYNIRVKSIGEDIKIIVDLDKPLPEEWVGQVGFNLELFPGTYFGRTFIMDNKSGIFPRQPSGSFKLNNAEQFQIEPLAVGNKLIIAPESDEVKISIKSKEEIQLLDGRGNHNNGWFIIRSLIPAGISYEAMEWVVTPNVIHGWKHKPVAQVSQVGYLQGICNKAIIELDKKDTAVQNVVLYKITEGGKEILANEKPLLWGDFLRYTYYTFNFSDKINGPGYYQINYGDYKTNPFKVSSDVFEKSVWQPTLEYFLPVQMCHMRVNENYRVWHGLCHDDDALMAEVDTNHFDGYLQESSTLTKFKPLQHVEGLNIGGWHDAGDYDLRIESQADEVKILSWIFEEFKINHDNTTINQKNKIVEIHQPDGKPDVLQQVEHGVLSIVGGYKVLGRFYRGIICPTLRQYVLLGDAANNTDNKIYDPTLKSDETSGNSSGLKDDNWVFTEENPGREINTAAALAAAHRVLKDYNPELASDCIRIAEEVWKSSKAHNGQKIPAAVELLLATNKNEYKTFILQHTNMLLENFERFGWLTARVIKLINEDEFTTKVTQKVMTTTSPEFDNPYGVPYKPDIWGAGWGIQEWGVRQYFIHKAFPKSGAHIAMINALNFILGCHPGTNTSSFVSGVGVNSLLTAYGTNRADWSHIPGGVASGTAIIRPDLPELKVWPYFWQQGEYVMGGGATNFMFLALAANQLKGN